MDTYIPFHNKWTVIGRIGIGLEHQKNQYYTKHSTLVNIIYIFQTLHRRPHQTSSLKVNLKTCSKHRLSRVSSCFVVTASRICFTEAACAAELPSLRTLLYEHKNRMVSRDGQLRALARPRCTWSINWWMLRLSRRSSQLLH